MYVEIRDYTDSHYLVIVTTNRGYSYASKWAKGEHDLTEAEVRAAWRENRKKFDPWYRRLE